MLAEKRLQPVDPDVFAPFFHPEFVKHSQRRRFAAAKTLLFPFGTKFSALKEGAFDFSWNFHSINFIPKGESASCYAENFVPKRKRLFFMGKTSAKIEINPFCTLEI